MGAGSCTLTADTTVPAEGKWAVAQHELQASTWVADGPRAAEGVAGFRVQAAHGREGVAGTIAIACIRNKSKVSCPTNPQFLRNHRLARSTGGSTQPGIPKA